MEIETRGKNTGAIFIVIGLLFLVIGIFVCYNAFSLKGKVETKATITDVIRNVSRTEDEDGSTSEEISYDVYVEYEVNGKTYNSRLDGFSSGHYEGEEITIYYKEGDPTKIYQDPSTQLPLLIAPLLGAIVTIVGIVTVIKQKKEEL